MIKYDGSDTLVGVNVYDWSKVRSWELGKWYEGNSPEVKTFSFDFKLKATYTSTDVVIYVMTDHRVLISMPSFLECIIIGSVDQIDDYFFQEVDDISHELSTPIVKIVNSNQELRMLIAEGKTL